MKSFKHRLKRNDSVSSTEWTKYDEKLLKAVECGDVDKVTSILKKGAVPTKLDADGHSAFHLAASKGLLKCLNIFLGHGVDVKAADSKGKTALHLAVGNGHSSCLQRLLQCNCPVDCTDHQGWTPLHEAAYGGCTTGVKYLCDSGASVFAMDMEGRTPLILAAQMGHAGTCEQLLLCGAITAHRDKHNKTALIVACERGCKGAVDVLLKSKADVTAVDIYGHDAFHYARHSQDPELIKLVKNALESATKAKEAARAGQKSQQAKSLMLGGGRGVSKMDKVQTEQHMREHGSRPAEGKDAPPLNLTHNLDSIQAQQLSSPSAPVARAVPRPVEPCSGEMDALRRELREVRRRQEAAEGEVHRLEAELVLRVREYEELRRNSERALHESHARSWELEEALGEVQRRMADSETRVRQMQAHLMAVREHLVEELRAQLQEAKGQREAAVMELSRLQRDLSHSRREVQEHREGQGILIQEVQRLNEELINTKLEKKTMREKLTALETSPKDKEVQTVSQETQTTSESPSLKIKGTEPGLRANGRQQSVEKGNYISIADHEALKTSLSSALRQAEAKAQEALMKHQHIQEENENLLRELREQKTELDTIQKALHAKFVPVAEVEEKEKELAQLRLALVEMEQKNADLQALSHLDKTCVSEEGALQLKPRENQTSGPQSLSELQSSDVAQAGETEESKLQTRHDSRGVSEEHSVEVLGTQVKGSVSPLVAAESEVICGPLQTDSSLQAQIQNLQQQLKDTEKHYKEIVSMYRTRLLNAAQGYMDEEARVALLQIAQMRQEYVY